MAELYPAFMAAWIGERNFREAVDIANASGAMRIQDHPFRELAIVLANAFGLNDQKRTWKEICEQLTQAAGVEISREKIFLNDVALELQIARKQREAKTLLIIDQTEELLVRSEEEKAASFLSLLRCALEAPNTHLHPALRFSWRISTPTGPAGSFARAFSRRADGHGALLLVSGGEVQKTEILPFHFFCPIAGQGFTRKVIHKPGSRNHCSGIASYETTLI